MVKATGRNSAWEGSLEALEGVRFTPGLIVSEARNFPRKSASLEL